MSKTGNSRPELRRAQYPQRTGVKSVACHTSLVGAPSPASAKVSIGELVERMRKLFPF